MRLFGRRRRGERLVIVGPSHVPRWKHLVLRCGWTPPAPDTVFIGDGGHPVWEAGAFAQCRALVTDPADRILLIVGDFRFGNRILAEPDRLAAAQPFAAGYTHVDRSLITPANDLRLKGLCLAALAAWKQQFGAQLRICHWTLAINTLRNRMAGRHLRPDGSYHHPTWNLGEFELFGGDLLDHGVFLAGDPAVYGRLFIDRDVHPSPLGYSYLGGLCRGLDHAAAFAAADAEMASELTPPPIDRPVGIAGDSHAFEVLRKTASPALRAAWRERGLILLDDDTPPPDRVLFLSKADIADPASFLGELEAAARRFGPGVRVEPLAWESLTARLVAERAAYREGADLACGPEQEKMLQRTTVMGAESFLAAGRADSLIDHGVGGAPTIRGLQFILAIAANARQDDRISRPMESHDLRT